MRRSLLIDDARELGTTKTARDYFEGIRLLKEEGPWDILYLDHDLACFRDGKEYTGYSVICWLEENPQYLPGEICCVSSNPVGRNRIIEVAKKLYERE